MESLIMFVASNVTSTVTGTYTARIETQFEQPDFAATHLSVSGTDGQYFHFYGTEGDPFPTVDYRGIYIIVEKDGSQLKVNRFGFLDKKSDIYRFYEGEDGEFTFDFDEEKGRYKMTFKIEAYHVINKVKIDGSFNLTVN